MSGIQPTDAQSLKVKIKDDKVTITFNAQNWSARHTNLLDAIAIDAEFRNISMAESLMPALEYRVRQLCSSKEAFERYIRLLDKLEEDELPESKNTKPEIDQPK